MPDCLACEDDLPAPEATRRLCTPCATATRDHLEALPGLYTALQDFLRPAVRPEPAGRPAVHTHAPMPVSERVLDLRGPGGAVTLVEDWHTALADDLGEEPPAIAGTYDQRLTRAVRVLLARLPWIAAAWPAAGAFAEEIRDLERDMRSIVDPAPARTRAGRCTARLLGGDVCGAVVWHEAGQRGARCSWCGAVYPPGSWFDLAAAERAAVE